MSKSYTHAISPNREENFPEWYQQVIRHAEMAEHSEVRGCMVIRPWGYALWERIQGALDAMLKATGHKNAYFPLFIPLGHLQKEAEHVEGFAKECAVVTHHRLELKDGSLVPSGELAEPLVVRPTSETIIGATYAKWVKSYRDLPILLNQWANVVRWELRPRLFLRTSEFLWQEGHTVHETESEAREETLKMLDVYESFAHEWLAIPVIRGEKTPSERFPGAVCTYCIEAMVQDHKAIQAGTSHFLGQNFSKASGIKFLSRKNTEELAWTTSWGVSTRLIGAVLMTHGDDDGACLPPRIAGTQIIMIPMISKKETSDTIMNKTQEIADSLCNAKYAGESLRVEIDKRDLGGGTKRWEWIKKGVPIRIEIGTREIESGYLAVARRDRDSQAKEFLPSDSLLVRLPEILHEIQTGLLNRALAFRESHTIKIDTKEEFYSFFTPKNSENPEIHGGFALTHWNGSREVEEKIKQDLKVTIRCIPTSNGREFIDEAGICPFSGEPSTKRVIFGKSY